jgi:hypothetical protein
MMGKNNRASMRFSKRREREMDVSYQGTTGLNKSRSEVSSTQGTINPAYLAIERERKLHQPGEDITARQRGDDSPRRMGPRLEDLGMASPRREQWVIKQAMTIQGTT